jgi:hypothetical protein
VATSIKIFSKTINRNSKNMSDTIKKWHEMQEEFTEVVEVKTAKYIFLLDFTDGKAYRYDISVLCNEENKWNPDTESCESFLYGAGHQIINCEWMVTSKQELIYGN